MAEVKVAQEFYGIDPKGELPDHLEPVLRLLATADPAPNPLLEVLPEALDKMRSELVVALNGLAAEDGLEPMDPELDQLTPREKEVLRQIARGYSYKQVARRLSISIKTVESHVSAVLRKLQLSSRYELTRWATDRRIV